MQEDILSPEKPLKSKPKTSPKNDISYSFADIDFRRIIIAMVVIAVLVGGLNFWAKNGKPQFLNVKEKQAEVPKEEQAGLDGVVAGDSDFHFSLDSQQTTVQQKIDDIKKSVLNLDIDELKDQEQVKKILSDLEELTKKASESAKILDVKGNICEEAKKRFCQ